MKQAFLSEQQHIKTMVTGDGASIWSEHGERGRAGWVGADRRMPASRICQGQAVETTRSSRERRSGPHDAAAEQLSAEGGADEVLPAHHRELHALYPLVCASSQLYREKARRRRAV